MAKTIKQFIEDWKDKGNEKSDTQTFWIDLLRDVLGCEEKIIFEKHVELDHVSFIDAYIPSTRVIIEQKSKNIDLTKPAKQSDGTMKTPFEQAKRYSDWLPASERADWIVTCNFQEIRIHDMEKPKAEPEIIKLTDLNKNKLQFLVDVNATKPKDIHELEISVKAGELVGKLYEALLKRYKNPSDEHSLKSLNVLCVRIVFLLYAEDSGLFNKSAFHDYMLAHKDSSRRALIDLFGILAQDKTQRDPYADSDLLAFQYVNGGLFNEDDIEIPQLEGEPLDIILHEMSEGFDWSNISPTIFGAVFESTLNPETRRKGGMHYTSIENIHKVIDPLFLDELKAELDEILNMPKGTPGERRTRTRKINAFQKKLGTLTFLDPACGSGNFLTETYLCLRRLENKILFECRIQPEFVGSLEDINYIQVSISQFYGIEINDFAVSVARTALWIAEAQMMDETKRIVQILDDFLPLKSYNHIVEGNALRMDWGELVKPEELNYIMGNPPFSAARRMSTSQRSDMEFVAKDFSRNGELDYVCCWYICATKFMMGHKIKTGFVSTSSITQGEQVVLLWKKLFNEYNLDIFFAIRPFTWKNEAKVQAGVHCVIIEFVTEKYHGSKILADGDKLKMVHHINGYLLATDDIWIEGQKNSISGAPQINNGSKPLDNAICTFTPEEKREFIQKEPKAASYFYRYMGSREFLNGIERYFLFINKIPPHLLRHMPLVLNLIEQIRTYRLSSESLQTKKLAETPTKFHFENIPENDYLVIPQTSSGRRQYVPIGFLSKEVLVNNKLQVMKNGGLYEFGILSSSVHNSWIRTVAGRLRDDFSYSVSIVYNTFAWPEKIKAEQKAKIEATAQSILDARAKYPDSSLADLYDSLTMPAELLKAHRTNDEAVLTAYGFPKDISEEDIVARLMFLYNQKTKEA